jgi:hypothetical protein
MRAIVLEKFGGLDSLVYEPSGSGSAARRHSWSVTKEKRT